MTTIVTRAGKGSPLTNVEVDANFTNLNNDKLEKTGGTITANSSSAALTITQTGVGNALVVEDAASDTTPFVIAASGNVYVGGSIDQAIGNSTTTGGSLTVRSHDGVEGGQISLLNKANTNGVYNFDVDGSDHGRIFTTQNNTNLTIGQVAGAGGSVSIHTGGLSRVRVASDGHVGIGTTPAVPSGFSRFVAIGDADTGIGQISDGVLAVSTNNVERMRIDSAGNVGIGSTPKTRLQATAAANLNAPVLGSATNAPFYVTNSDASYGLLVGINAADGSAWMQVQRTDGAATAYDIRLQPEGGNTLHVGSKGGLGYGTGAGGTVNQTGGRTTGVTLSKPTGSITLVSAAGSTSWQSFTVTNTVVSADDVIKVCQKSGADKYMIHVTNVATGSFQITFATTGGTTTEQPVFSFVVIKGATA